MIEGSVRYQPFPFELSSDGTAQCPRVGRELFHHSICRIEIRSLLRHSAVVRVVFMNSPVNRYSATAFSSGRLSGLALDMNLLHRLVVQFSIDLGRDIADVLVQKWFASFNS